MGPDLGNRPRLDVLGNVVHVAVPKELCSLRKEGEREGEKRGEGEEERGRAEKKGREGRDSQMQRKART